MTDNEKLYTVLLTHEELRLIDGKCSERAQKVVDTAKAEHSYGLDCFSNEVLNQSMIKGKLTWSQVEISSCKHCGKKTEYATYTRNSRYHNKGDIDYSRPIKLRGMSVNHGLIVFSNLPGVCLDCWNNIYLPKIINYIIEHDMPIEIQKNDIAKTRYKRDVMRRCKECGEFIYESEMLGEYSFFTGNTYPGKCPHCKSSRIEYLDETKFRMKKIEV